MAGKKINFIYCIEPYNKVLGSIIDPIIQYLPDATKIFKFMEGQLNVCFFPELNIRNAAFISHGIGDKCWRDGRKVKDFEAIFVSGPAWKDKLCWQGVDEDKIYINGFPKLDPFFNNRQRKIYSDDKIHVIYAPTHNTNVQNPKSISSYPRLLAYLNVIPKDIELVTSAHPYNNDSNVITLDLFQWADVIISDSSSIIYEAFALDLPVVFPDWLVKDNISRLCKGSFTEMIYQNNLGYHAENIEQLWDLVRETKNRGLGVPARNFIEGILPKSLRGNSGKTTASQLLEISNK